MNYSKTNEEVRKYLQTNENGNKAFQTLWDAAKKFLRGVVLVIQAFLKNQEKHQIKKLTCHLRKLEKQTNKQTKTKVSRRKEKIKVKEKVN